MDDQSNVQLETINKFAVKWYFVMNIKLTLSTMAPLLVNKFSMENYFKTQMKEYNVLNFHLFSKMPHITK